MALSAAASAAAAAAPSGHLEVAEVKGCTRLLEEADKISWVLTLFLGAQSLFIEYIDAIIFAIIICQHLPNL